MKTLAAAVCIAVMFAFAGCGDAPAALNASATANTAPDYTAYLGNWISSDAAATRSEVYDKGGSAIQLLEIGGANVSGNIIAVSESQGHREAQVDFEGKIAQGKLEYEFTEDGWGDSGTIVISFDKDGLHAAIDTLISEENSSGWCIGNGEYYYIREKTSP